MSVFDHVALYVPGDKFEDEIKFYNGALASFNMKEQMRPMPLIAAIGDDPHKQPLWISGRTQEGPITGTVTGSHIAFKAKDQDQVNEFHKAAIAAGGKDNGAPGFRTMYHPGYYAAFVHSPAGHNIEVVFHDYSWMQKDA